MRHPSTEVLNEFRHRHPLRPPPSSAHPHEDIQLGTEDELRVLGTAPAIEVEIGLPPVSRDDENSTNRYLWVIDQRGVPYIIERPLGVIEDNEPKHTNLTGGGQACLGGEMWFASGEALYVSGGSGRYPPTDQSQLEEAVEVFESFGYEVKSLGWDHGTRRALRYWEGDEWPA